MIVNHNLEKLIVGLEASVTLAISDHVPIANGGAMIEEYCFETEKLNLNLFLNLVSLNCLRITKLKLKPIETHINHKNKYKL